MEKALRKRARHDDADVAEAASCEAQEILVDGRDRSRHLVVQRSRAYARESQIRETGNAAAFPTAKPHRSPSTRSARPTASLLDMFENGLPDGRSRCSRCRCTTRWPTTGARRLRSTRSSKNRQKQVVGLIRTQLPEAVRELGRTRSSCPAIGCCGSCWRSSRSTARPTPRRSASSAGSARTPSILGYAPSASSTLWGDDERRGRRGHRPAGAAREAVETLDRDEYDVDGDARRDLPRPRPDRRASSTRPAKFEPKHDDKLPEAHPAARSRRSLPDHKVLIFTEFADTARYLAAAARRGRHRGRRRARQRDARANRADVIQRFSPYYNGSSSAELAANGQQRDPRADLHRRSLRGPEPPGRHAADQLRHPLEPGAPDAAHRPRRSPHEPRGRERGSSPTTRRWPLDRGKVSFWNFLPPDELNDHPHALHARSRRRRCCISKTLGIEGKKLLTPEDDYDALKEFNHAYEGTKTADRGDAPRVPGAARRDDPESRGAPRAAARRGLQRPRAGRQRALAASSSATRSRRSTRRRASSPRRRATTRWYLYDLDRRRDPRGARRDRRQHPLQARDAARAAPPKRRPWWRCATQGREAHQEHLPEAGRRARRASSRRSGAGWN